MLEGIHFLLTYTCNFRCQHCFLHCGPRAAGTFRIEQICAVLDQAKELETVKNVCFEGGEPTLFYPLLLEAIRQATRRGFGAGLVSNAYWATSVADAKLWMRPLHELGVGSITISDDALHYGDRDGSHKQIVEAAAKELGMQARAICTQPPTVVVKDGVSHPSGGVMFRGRAAEELTVGMPKRNWQEMRRCPHEALDGSGRVHVDSYGNVHLCQGLLLGNLWKTPLKELVEAYRPELHPIVGPLLRGGPAELVRVYGVEHENSYVDECHLCYMARKALLPRFPAELAPAQVYGADSKG